MSHNAVSHRVGVFRVPIWVKSIPNREKISATYDSNFSLSSGVSCSRNVRFSISKGVAIVVLDRTAWMCFAGIQDGTMQPPFYLSGTFLPLFLNEQLK